MQDGVPGHFDTYWAVRKDGPVRTIEDLRHRHAAINAFGATTDMVLRGTLRQHGVADNEYVVIEANFANMLAMMENDKIDLVPVMPQFNHDFAATGRYRTLFTVGQARGPSRSGCGRSRPASSRRTGPNSSISSRTTCARCAGSSIPKNREEALAIAQAVTEESRAALDYAFGPGDLYHSPDLLPNIAAVQKDIDQAAEMKLLPARVVVDPTYVDLTPCRRSQGAARRQVMDAASAT